MNAWASVSMATADEADVQAALASRDRESQGAPDSCGALETSEQDKRPQESGYLLSSCIRDDLPLCGGYICSC